jgi:hypothetical protein
VALAIRLFIFVDRWAVNVLFFDQWDFLTGLFEHRDLLSLFRWQHGPQRQGFGYLLLAALYPATGWNTRIEIFVLAGIVVLAAIVALLLVRQLCGRSVWDVCVPLICLTTAQVEIFAVTANPAHGALPLLFIFLCAWAWTAQRDSVRTIGVSLANFAAVSTGFSWFVGLITPLFFLLDFRAARRAAKPVYLSIIGFLFSLLTLWSHFAGLRFDPALGCFRFPHTRPGEYILLLGLYLAHPFRLNGLTGLRGVAAAAVAVGALVFLLTRVIRLVRKDERLDREIVLLMGFSILFGLSVAIGRVCLGPEAGASSRYVPYAIPAGVAIYLWIRSWPRPSQKFPVVLMVFLAVCIFKEIWSLGDRGIGRYYASGKTRWRDCYLAKEDIARCNRETQFEVYPSDNPGAVNIPAKLAFLKDHHLNLFRER